MKDIPFAFFVIHNPSLQPYNQWDPDKPDSEGDDEGMCGTVYDDNDGEMESENDDWFDQFIKSGSTDSVAPTELDPPSPTPPGPRKDGQGIARPVARPLNGSKANDGDVMMIEDSPMKVEMVEEEPKMEDIKAQKQKEIANLRAQLNQLEEHVASSRLGT